MTEIDRALSTISNVPASYFVYSSFSFFGIQRNGELPGAWFVRALGDAGRTEATVRQTLYRMEREEELTTRRVGRVKFYAPSAYALAEISAGSQKIFAPVAREWDGQWTLVHVGLRTPALAKHRERVVALLAVEGYARLDANTFAHPNAPVERLMNALDARARHGVTVVRGQLASVDTTATLVSHWRLGTLRQRYLRAISKLERLHRIAQQRLSDRDAFLLRFAVVFDHLRVAWDDPGLPPELLAADWPAERARKLAADLYERLLPAAIRYADALLDEVTGASLLRRGLHR